MSSNAESRVLLLLQPDLLTTEELIEKIKSRCRIENLEKMSKEGLVEIFRRVILPLPQRFYRTNRRGKMLSSRRAKAGLESKGKEQGSHDEPTFKEASSCSHRLKPPPDISHPHKIRISSYKKSDKEPESHKIKIKNGKSDLEDRNDIQEDSSSGRKITLKRSSSEKSSRSAFPTESKRQRTPIKWP